MIKPITNISYNNYNFTGSKKSSNQNNIEYAPKTFIKAIPLAALIAMSPLVETQNTYAAEQYAPKVTMNSEDGEVVDVLKYPNAIEYDGSDAEIKFIKGYDGNIKVSVKFTSEGTYYNDKGIGDQSYIYNMKELKALKLRNIFETYENAKPKKIKKYYLEGDINCIKSAVFDEKGRVINKGWGYDKKEIEVSKDFYMYMKDLLEGIVPDKVDNVIIDGKTKRRISK